MKARVALLRGINVGGRTVVPMPALLEAFAAVGCVAATTVLQSGNVLFGGGEADPAILESRLEAEVLRRFGQPFAVLVRSAEDWAALRAGNPFPREAAADPAHLLVMVTRQQLDEAAVASLQGAIRGRERVRAGDRCLYIHYPDGIGRSRLTGGVIEARLDTRGTARNWNTVERIAAGLEQA